MAVGFYKARKIAFEKVKRLVRGNVPDQTIVLTIQTEFGFGKRLIETLIKDAKEMGFKPEIPKEEKDEIAEVLQAKPVVPKEKKVKKKKGKK